MLRRCIHEAAQLDLTESNCHSISTQLGGRGTAIVTKGKTRVTSSTEKVFSRTIPDGLPSQHLCAWKALIGADISFLVNSSRWPTYIGNFRVLRRPCCLC